MLDLEPQADIVALTWEQTQLKTRLPKVMADFFEQLGMMPHRSGCRRAYDRFFIRGKAILRWQDICYGVYSADASRQGLRFLSPIELQPTERGRIRLPSTKDFQIEIVRGHRIDEFCYDCGAVFVLGK
jgi:hypothetical protein